MSFPSGAIDLRLVISVSVEENSDLKLELLDQRLSNSTGNGRYKGSRSRGRSSVGYGIRASKVLSLRPEVEKRDLWQTTIKKTIGRFASFQGESEAVVALSASVSGPTSGAIEDSLAASGGSSASSSSVAGTTRPR